MALYILNYGYCVSELGIYVVTKAYAISHSISILIMSGRFGVPLHHIFRVSWFYPSLCPEFMVRHYTDLICNLSRLYNQYLFRADVEFRRLPATPPLLGVRIYTQHL